MPDSSTSRMQPESNRKYLTLGANFHLSSMLVSAFLSFAINVSKVSNAFIQVGPQNLRLVFIASTFLSHECRGLLRKYIFHIRFRVNFRGIH